MSDKKRKLLKQTSLVDFMCGTGQSKRRKTEIDMDAQEKDQVKKAAEKRLAEKSPYFVKDQNETTSKSNSSKSEANSSKSEASSSKSTLKDATVTNDIMFDDEFIPSKKPTKTSVNVAFKGVPLAYLKCKPSCSVQETKLKPSSTHTVLFECPYIYDVKKSTPPSPHPKNYKDKWDKDYVRMPCSNSNEYPVETSKGTELKRRWELIESAFKDNLIPGPFELEEAILSYNQRYKSRWDFLSFRKFFIDYLPREEREKFFGKTLPKIIKLALLLPHLCTQPIPLLQKHMNHSISLSQQQIACLLANAFLCTFPRRNSRQKGAEYSSYPDINFNSLYQGGSKKRKFEKLKCIIHYFERVTTKMPTGTVTFTRQYIDTVPNWDDLRQLVPDNIHVSANGTIEDDGFGMLQVDFANKFLGGGVLNHGCVQEEIRFLICPEMLISRLFTEVLDNKECLLMKGCERFSDYDGYADSFTWFGNHIDTTPRDCNGQLYSEVVAIDALVIHSPNDQFKSSMVKRELTKAYVGFEIFEGKNIPAANRSAVCTGNWGCGAFRGDKQLKALIQLMAASVANRDVCYFTFGDDRLTNDIYEIHKFLKESEVEIGVLMLTIEGYYRNVCQTYRRSKKKVGLFQYIFESYEGINHSESEESGNEVDIDNNSYDIHDSSRENSIDCDDIDLTEDDDTVKYMLSADAEELMIMDKTDKVTKLNSEKVQSMAEQTKVTNPVVSE